MIPQDRLDARDVELAKAVFDLQAEVADLTAKRELALVRLANTLGRLEELRSLRSVDKAAAPISRAALADAADESQDAQVMLRPGEQAMLAAVRKVLAEATEPMRAGEITDRVNRILGTSYSRDALRPLVKRLCNVAGSRVTTTYTLRTKGGGTANRVTVLYGAAPTPPGPHAET